MKILGIEHIGVAVHSIDERAAFWEYVLKINRTATETVADQGVSTAIFDTGKGKIELLEAIDSDSPIAKYIAKRGPGIHHICLEVDDISSAIKELTENGISVINETPSVGVEGYFITFIHPRSTGGVLVLVELAQKQKP
ncbi:MAG: methylmalonyl-CoA epimerase [FCB group bacterium]|nr:methylmalonyl-CoA epimerase [FCB group bacterium]